MEGRYVIITIIVAIFIVCLIFYPFDDTINTRSKENFTSQEIQDNMSDIELVVERVVNEINQPLITNIVTPCMSTTNLVTIDDKINCISSYQYFYTQILEDPITDMYYYLDQLDLLPFDKIDMIKQKQQKHRATIMLVSAFSKALTLELRYLQGIYPTFGYDSNSFTQRLNYLATELMGTALVQILQNPDGAQPDLTTGEEDNVGKIINNTLQDMENEIANGSKDLDSTPSADTMDMLPSTLQLQPMNETETEDYMEIDTDPMDQVIDVTCDDLNSGAVQIYVDGARIECVE